MGRARVGLVLGLLAASCGSRTGLLGGAVESAGTPDSGTDAAPDGDLDAGSDVRPLDAADAGAPTCMAPSDPETLASWELPPGFIVNPININMMAKSPTDLHAMVNALLVDFDAGPGDAGGRDAMVDAGDGGLTNGSIQGFLYRVPLATKEAELEDSASWGSGVAADTSHVYVNVETGATLTNQMLARDASGGAWSPLPSPPGFPLVLGPKTNSQPGVYWAALVDGLSTSKGVIAHWDPSSGETSTVASGTGVFLVSVDDTSVYWTGGETLYAAPLSGGPSSVVMSFNPDGADVIEADETQVVYAPGVPAADGGMFGSAPTIRRLDRKTGMDTLLVGDSAWTSPAVVTDGFYWSDLARNQSYAVGVYRTQLNGGGTTVMTLDDTSGVLSGTIVGDDCAVYWLIVDPDGHHLQVVWRATPD